MQRSPLNSLCKKCSSVLFRRLSDGSKSSKDDAARVIKNLHKENKSLFGALIETIPQKRKRTKGEPVRMTDDDVNINNISTKNTDKASEIWWWERSSSYRPIQFKNHEEAKKKRRTSSVENHSADINESPTGLVSSHVPSELSDNTSISCPGKKDTPATTKSSNLNTSMIVPPVIVKNIKTFPLENKNKVSSKWATPVDAIIRFSVEEESEDKKKLYLTFPSVSRILNATMSESSQRALQRWREKKIAELGEEGFQQYHQGLLDHGSKFHNTVEHFLSGTPADELHVDSAVEGCWNSLAEVIKNVENVKVLESHVVHSQLMYRGFVDCIAMYRGKPLLIEWKKSDKQKSQLWSTYDAPLQVAAYVGALNYDSNYDFKVKGGLVVVAYTDGSPAHVHKLGVAECQNFWYMWLHRLHKYWTLLEQPTTSS